MASAVMYATKTVSGNQPITRRLAEKATQTFLIGVPVMIDPATGFAKEWDGVTIANGLAGIGQEAGANLTANGVAKTLTLAQGVQNQPAASIIPLGAPINDGRTGVYVANDDTIFYGQINPATVTTQSLVGGQFGMTKDGDNHWFVDTTKTGASAVVVVNKLDPNDTRGVQFTFLVSVRQIAG